MKKTIMFLLLITSAVFSQNYNSVNKKTTINETDGIIVHDVSANYSYGVTMPNIAAYIFGNARTVAGGMSFTNTVQLPSTISAELVRGVGYSSGLFSWVNDDTVRVGADRAWVLNAMDTAGIAAGASNYPTLDGNNILTGTNTLSNRTSIGSGANAGELLIPRYTSTNKPTSILGSFYFNTSYNKLKAYNGTTWRTFLDSAGVASMVTTGSYLSTTATQTGLSSSLTWSSGTLTPYILDPFKLYLTESSTPTTEGQLNYEVDGTDLSKGMYLYGNGSIHHIPTVVSVKENVETYYINYDSPTQVSGDAIAMTMTKKNIIAYEVIENTEEECYITVSGFGYGKMLSFMVKDLTSNATSFTLNVTGATLDYGEQTAPNWLDGKWYLVQLIGISSNVCAISYTRFNR